MDESGENGWFSRRNGGETNTNFLLETDADGSQLLPQYEPSMSMYAASLLDLQSETNKCNDSEITNTNELHYSGSDEELFDNHTEQCNTEATSGDEFLRGLKERYRYHEYQEAQASTSFSMNTTKACSASEPPLTTRSIASSPVSNHSNAEQLETIILEGVRQKMPSCDLLNHTEQHQLTDLLKTIVKQEVDKLKEEFVLIPKSEADRSSISESDRSSKSEADRKSKKKRKHHDDRHRLRKEKVARYGSTSSLNDLFRPSTSHGSSTPKRSGKKCSLHLFISIAFLQKMSKIFRISIWKRQMVKEAAPATYQVAVRPNTVLRKESKSIEWMTTFGLVLHGNQKQSHRIKVIAKV